MYVHMYIYRERERFNKQTYIYIYIYAHVYGVKSQHAVDSSPSRFLVHMADFKSGSFVIGLVSNWA